MSQRPQSFDDHAKMVAGYHYVAFGLILVLLISAVADVVRNPGWAALEGVILVVALVLVGFYARVFALGVQDRVIRLEERMRMERLLPEDLQARIGDVPTEALIGLRFASDDELEGLVRRVLDGGLTTRKEVKAAVKNWRADHQRI